MFKLIIFSFLFVLSTAAVAKNNLPTVRYYGQYFEELLQLKDQDLKDKLKEIISTSHIKKEAAFDELVSGDCDENQEQACEKHKSLGYDRARFYLYHEIYAQDIEDVIDDAGVLIARKMNVTEVYCGKKVSVVQDMLAGTSKKNFPDHNVLNAEHAWPQSKFQPKSSTKKSDLHHLYASDNDINGRLRANFSLGEVKTIKPPSRKGKLYEICGNKAGDNENGDLVFEPKDELKGDFARSYFYFSTRYGNSISQAEELVLKKWHTQDPVSAFEMNKNNIIHTHQGNRNPYIDFPTLVDKVSDF